MNINPFNLNNIVAYEKWRDIKLQNYPKKITDLIVEVKDPSNLTDSEYQAILKNCRLANMSIYVSETGNNPDKNIPIAIGRKFKVSNLNNNWLADDDGVTSLMVRNDDGVRKQYIPYTNKPIKWHTDGYYNTTNNQIYALLLHCVESAALGGENALMDHEIAYILLRDKNPNYIKALMADDVMTIPARLNADGTIARAEESGYVFGINSQTGDLHMRYTERLHNVIWKNDDVAMEALAYLKNILYSDNQYIFRGRLESGMGLICNNVLHDRQAFSDSKDKKRLIYRARYFNRLAETSIV
jgi:hypothetical protein